MRSRVPPLCCLALLAACERDPLDVPCPAAGAGDLVITEVNTAGSSTNDDEQWIEVYNASDSDLNLAGMAVRLRTLNGSRDERVVVRSRDVAVAAGGYAVFGNVADDGARPDYIDYGYGVEFDGNLPEPGAVDLLGCEGLLLDQVIVRDFPGSGSLSFDGAREPAAADNDEADPRAPGSGWCEDPEQSGDAPGTPGAANRPCAP